MLNLDNYEKFKSDIYSNTTNLHPIVIINSNPVIYLSQNDEIIDINGLPTVFNSLNLKLPSIKESIDLESRKLKVNNVVITISNHKLFSDLFGSQTFLNTPVEVYWKSPSCTSLSDCFPIYRATIQRINHDYKNVKIILEDLTEAVMHKKVPITVLSSENAIVEKDINKIVPMTYGDVQKAPCVLYKNEHHNTDTVKKIYALPDRFDVPNKIGFSNPDDCFDYETPYEGLDNISGWSSYLYVYSGEYLRVMSDLFLHDNIDEGVDDDAPDTPIVQLATEYWDPEDEGAQESDITLPGSRTFLRATYNSETPTNTIGWGVLQVLYHRKPSDVTIMDEDYYNVGGVFFQNFEIAYDFVGAEEGVFIHNAKNSFDKSWESYATCPDSSLSSYNELMDEDGFINAKVQNGTDISTTYNYSDSFSSEMWNNHISGMSAGEWKIRWSESAHTGGAMSDFEPIEDKSQYWSIHRRHGDLTGGRAEFICLPDSKKLYDLFNFWHFQENPNSPSVLPFSNGEHKMTINGDGFNLDTYLPNYLYNLELEDGSFAKIIFNRAFDGSFVAGYQDALESLEEDTDYISIDFWNLLDYYSIYHNDLPRYVLETGSTFVTEEFIAHEDYENKVFHKKKELDVKWNGVYHDFWDNTGETGGSSGYFDALYGNHNWNTFFSSSQWHLHLLEDYTVSNSGIIIPKGTFLPGTQSMPRFKYTDLSNPQDIFEGTWKIAGQQKIPDTTYTVPGEPVYTNIAHGEGLGIGSGFDDTSSIQKRVLANRIILQDSGVVDAIEGSGVTYFYGKSDVIAKNISGYDGNSTLQLRVACQDIFTSGSAFDIETEQVPWGSISRTYLDNLATQEEEWISAFDSRNFPTTEDNSIVEMFNPLSYTWSSPDLFNAAALYWQVDANDSLTSTIQHSGLVSADISTRIHHLSIKHVFEISDFANKTFYKESLGRSGGNMPEGSPPTAIIRDIIERELEIEVGIHDSFYEINNLLSSSDSSHDFNGWKMAFSITKQMNSKKLIEEIAKSTPIIPLFRSDADLGMAMIKNEYTDNDVALTIKAMDVSKPSFKRTKVEKVKTMVRVKHSLDYETDNYQYTPYVDAYDFYGNGDAGFSYLDPDELAYIDGYKKTYYALDPENPGDSVLEFESNYVRQPSNYAAVDYFGSTTPEKLRDFILAFNCNQHNIIKFRLPLRYMNLEITDIIKFDSLINNLKCFGEDYTADYIRNGQTIYPYFMITSVVKSNKHVDIECFQMHKLTRSYYALNRQSGDFNRSGTVDQLSWNALEKQILYPSTYITEGQMYSCDMNNDKILDEADLSLLEEMIESNVDQAGDYASGIEEANIVAENQAKEEALDERLLSQGWTVIHETITNDNIMFDDLSIHFNDIKDGQAPYRGINCRNSYTTQTIQMMAKSDPYLSWLLNNQYPDQDSPNTAMWEFLQEQRWDWIDDWSFINSYLYIDQFTWQNNINSERNFFFNQHSFEPEGGDFGFGKQVAYNLPGHKPTYPYSYHETYFGTQRDPKQSTIVASTVEDLYGVYNSNQLTSDELEPLYQRFPYEGYQSIIIRIGREIFETVGLTWHGKWFNYGEYEYYDQQDMVYPNPHFVEFYSGKLNLITPRANFAPWATNFSNAGYHCQDPELFGTPSLPQFWNNMESQYGWTFPLYFHEPGETVKFYVKTQEPII